MSYNNELVINKKVQSLDGSTKYYYQLCDKEMVISVLIPKRNSLFNYCISCQIGCPCKCQHCATGKMEYIRDLSCQEIFAQVDLIKKNLDKNDKILFMGMGEPFFNYNNVLESCKLFVKNNIVKSYHNIIISTCGIIPGIKKLSNEKNRPKLAITIGNAIQSKRERLIPISKVFPIREVIEECIAFQEKTGDKIIFEYPLIRNINDSEEDIRSFIELIRSIECMIHVIPFNEFEGGNLKRPSNNEVKRFMKKLDEYSLDTYKKPSFGIDVYAGCGQLEIK